MRQSYIQTRTVDLLANRVVAMEVPGEFLLITAATGDFEISIDSTDWFPGLIGLKRTQKDPEGFIRVSFRSATAQTVTFVAGSGDYSGSRVQVTATIAGSVAVAEPAGTITAGSTRLTGSAVYTNRISLAVFNSGATNITANGTILKPAEMMVWPMAQRPGITYNPITIDATGGEALVTAVF